MTDFWDGFNKKYQSHKVYVVKVFAGEEKGKAGGFYYSWSPNGKIIGRVATGLDNKTLIQMAQNPEKFEGRAAQVISLEKHRKKLRKPEFQSWAA